MSVQCVPESALSTLIPPTSWRFDVRPRVLRAMQAETHRHAPFETTGTLYGGWQQGCSDRIIEVATWAGPRARHELLTSYVDLDYYHRWWFRLHGMNLWAMGCWHSHPFQDEPLPSPWDQYGGYPAGMEEHEENSGWHRMAKIFGGYYTEIIIGRKQARAWWVSEDYAWLVWEKKL